MNTRQTVLNGRKSSSDNVRPIKRGGNDTSYTLRRLARDAPEMLEKIEAGELSVNAAAIQAGIRKKPTPEEICVKAFWKCTDKESMIERLRSELWRAV